MGYILRHTSVPVVDVIQCTEGLQTNESTCTFGQPSVRIPCQCLYTFGHSTQYRANESSFRLWNDPRGDLFKQSPPFISARGRGLTGMRDATVSQSTSTQRTHRTARILRP